MGLTETLVRLRVCRDAGLAPDADLVSAAVRYLERLEDDTAQRARRNALICAAAAMLDEESAWARAGKLAQESSAMMRTWTMLSRRMPEAQPETVRAALHAAALCKPLPGGQRSFYRVLTSSPATDIEGASVVSGNAPSMDPCPENPASTSPRIASRSSR